MEEHRGVGPAGFGGRRILLVEDNEDNCNVYRLILEHGGYQVIEAHSGPEALACVGEHRPELILMDISIPGIDGWEATRLLKAGAETQHIPVIALTAHSLASDHARSVEVGCDGFLIKPVEQSRVLAEVRGWLT